MSGDNIFDFYVSKGGEYGQLLMTAHLSVGDKLFPMLEECERTGKKITLIDDSESDGCDDQPFTVKMV